MTGNHDTPLPRGLGRWHPKVLIATAGGAGLLPGAPGTWGSLLALPTGAAIHALGGAAALASTAVIAFLVGWHASSAWLAADPSRKDPGAIVIDEVVGQWLVLLVLPLDPLAYAGGFLLFRLFDIWKPWPVSFLDRRIGGGLGVMLDDVGAAIYAGAVALAVTAYLPV
jgi:phosphatidylglycerophosphatase A